MLLGVRRSSVNLLLHFVKLLLQSNKQLLSAFSTTLSLLINDAVLNKARC